MGEYTPDKTANCEELKNYTLAKHHRAHLLTNFGVNRFVEHFQYIWWNGFINHNFKHFTSVGGGKL